MNEWANFFSAMAESAATLSGLIFVGVSINLSKILSMPALPDRALESLILLLNILIISAQALIPHRSTTTISIEFIIISSIVWGFMLFLDVRIWRKAESHLRKHALQNMIFSQLAILPYLVSGIMMLNHVDSAIYWLVPGIMFSFIKAVIDAWVLLVEIHR
jgi:hypothetical protein